MIMLVIQWNCCLLQNRIWHVQWIKGIIHYSYKYSLSQIFAVSRGMNWYIEIQQYWSETKAAYLSWWSKRKSVLSLQKGKWTRISHRASSISAPGMVPDQIGALSCICSFLYNPGLGACPAAGCWCCVRQTLYWAKCNSYRFYKRRVNWRQGESE